MRDAERRRLDPGYIATTDNVPFTRRPDHLNVAHPLAKVAARFCREHSDSPRAMVGRAACGLCWERAIQIDEQVVVEHDLGRHLTEDRDLVDEVAVRLACEGELVELTEAERAVAVTRLLSQGLEPSEVGERLRMSVPTVTFAAALVRCGRVAA